MLLWIAQNIATVLIGAALAAAVAGIIAYMLKNKRKGRTSCGCGCENCALKGSCHTGK